MKTKKNIYSLIVLAFTSLFLITLGCEKDDPIELATVSTLSVSQITETSAMSGGNVTNDGGGAITARGVVWSTSANPTVDNNDGITSDGEGDGQFSSELTGLDPITGYYVRAYATNNEGTAYGNQVEFTTSGDLATVITSEVTDITSNFAISGGNVTDDGGIPVTARGVVWSTSENPTIDDNDGITTDGQGTGDFTSYLEMLESATIYFVRAYATNVGGTAYGDQISFTTKYKTVTIGDQEWMAENLKTTTFRDGSEIPHVPGDDWGDIRTPAYVFYGNDESHIETYGLLYNWYAVNDDRGLCPEGWRVPNDEDWKELEGYVDTEYGIGDPVWDETGFRGFDAGIRLMSSSGWDVETGLDLYGFSVLPGGYRGNIGGMFGEGERAYFWTATPDGDIEDATTSFRRHFHNDNEDIQRRSNLHRNGYSVRCIRDN